MTELTIFNFENKETRITIINGEPWFVAKDVAENLGYVWKGISTIDHVPEEWRGVYSVQTPSGMQDMLCLSEQGLYFFLGRSDKAKALSYQMKVAGEVMPSIRKHGAYMTTPTLENMIASPEFGITLLTKLKEEQDKRRELEDKVKRDAPKIIFADSVEASSTSILIGELATLLKQNGIEIGQNRLFDYLRCNGYLVKSGERHNMPTQKSMEMGLFEIREWTFNKPDGSIRITRTAKVTGKGQIYFINQFKNTQAA